MMEDPHCNQEHADSVRDGILHRLNTKGDPCAPTVTSRGSSGTNMPVVDPFCLRRQRAVNHKPWVEDGFRKTPIFLKLSNIGEGDACIRLDLCFGKMQE